MPENYKSISILKKILKINSQEQNINTNGLILPSEKMESIKKILKSFFQKLTYQHQTIDLRQIQHQVCVFFHLWN